MAEISTTSEFLNMDTSVDNILVADLDFGGVEITAFPDYTATLDGNYHTISNAVIDYQSLGSLFAETHDATIKNLTLDNIQSQGSTIGGIVSIMWGSSVVENCLIKNVEFYTAGSETSGIIAGRTSDNSQVNYCFANNVKDNNRSLNGMVRKVYNNSSINDCFYVDNYAITDNGAGTPLSDSEAKTASTYTGTGFDNSNWTIVDGEYPVLGIQMQEESDGIHLPIGISINSQTVLERHSDGVQVDLGVDVNSQVILERHSNGTDVGLQIDINSQEVTESYSNGSNIDLNIEVSSQEIETFSRGSSIDLEINIEGDGRQTLDLIQETILLADLKRGITLKGDRNVNINLNAEF